MKSLLLKVTKNFNVEFNLHNSIFSLFPALIGHKVDDKYCINLLLWIFEVEFQFIRSK